MEYRKFGDTYVVRIQRGEEIIEQLTALCKIENIRLGSIEGLGAAGKVTVGCYNVEEKHYYKTTFEGGTFEITSLTGNISEMNGEVYLHVHMSFAGEDGKRDRKRFVRSGRPGRGNDPLLPAGGS